MNFDTKYLIRWGIPGWLMVMALVPYFIVYYYDEIVSKNGDGILGYNAGEILAVGAALTVFGVPLGYILNQIHHSITWIIWRCIKNRNYHHWQDNYFSDETRADKVMEASSFKRERYRYLLSKKHEQGATMLSLYFSVFIIGSHMWVVSNINFSITYLIILTVLSCLFTLNRLYYGRNIDYYFNFLSEEDSESYEEIESQELRKQLVHLLNEEEFVDMLKSKIKAIEKE